MSWACLKVPFGWAIAVVAPAARAAAAIMVRIRFMRGFLPSFAPRDRQFRCVDKPFLDESAVASDGVTNQISLADE
jgi:hypothetical protein